MLLRYHPQILHKMAKQFSTLSIFLLVLLAFQEMMGSEAAMCSARSRLFTGLCFSRSNCTTICGREGFLYGACKGFRCVCTKDCNAGGGGGGGGGGDGGDTPGGGGDGGDTPGGDGGGDQPAVANRKYLIES